MKFRRSFPVLVCVLFASACASYVDTNLTTFHKLDGLAPGATISVLPVNVDQQRSLEFASYKSELESRLAAVGFVIQNLNPNYTAQMDYSINTGETVTTTNTGYRYQKTGENEYGDVYSNVPVVSSSTSTIYTRSVRIRIDRQTPPASTRVYEATAISKGTCGSLSSVMAFMLAAIFSDFPGENGKTETVRVDWDGSC